MMKIILLLFSIITLSLSLESVPAFKANEDYVQTGSLQINEIFLKNSQQIETVSIVSLIFKKPKATKYAFAAALQDLNIIFRPKISFKISASSSSSSSSTAGQISITWGINCSITRLRVRYITVIENINNFISFNQINLGSFTNSKSIIPPPPIRSLQYIMALINGLKISNNINLTYFDISLSNRFSNIIVSTRSNILSIQYQDFNMILVSYDLQQIILPMLKVERITIPLNKVTSASYSNSDNSMTQQNTFWGLNKIGFQMNQTQFQISSNLEEFKINASTNQLLRISQYIGLIISFKQCSPETPLYLQSINTCFDRCPIRYISNSNNQCIKCSLYDCFSCQQRPEGDICIQCSATVDFRVLNHITFRCDPLQGYYDDGKDNPIAQKCDSNCKTCNGTEKNCTSCNNQFVLNGDSNKCEACPAKCLKCTSKVVCTTCKPEYGLIDGRCRFQQSSSNVKVVASAATSFISCCALVAIFVFHKQNKQWNMNSEQDQQSKPTEENNNGNEVKKVVSTIIKNPSSNLVVINNSKMDYGQQTGYIVYQRSKRRRRGRIGRIE